MSNRALVCCLFLVPLGCGNDGASTPEGTPTTTDARNETIEVPLDDWHVNGVPQVGVARLAPAGDGLVRITFKLDSSVRFYPLRLTIYGGQTEGVGVATTKCEVVYNNTLVIPGSGRADFGIAIAYDPGEFASPRDELLVEASLDEITAAGDAIGLWESEHLLGCGDI